MYAMLSNNVLVRNSALIEVHKKRPIGNWKCSPNYIQVDGIHSRSQREERPLNNQIYNELDYLLTGITLRSLKFITAMQSMFDKSIKM